MDLLNHILGTCGETHINIYHIILYFVLGYLSSYLLYYLTKNKNG